MHEQCNYYVQCGSIYSRCNQSIMLDEDVTVILDIDVGTLIKVGKKDWVENYFNEMCRSYMDVGCQSIVDGLKLMTFDAKFDIDEICTIINWFNNSIGGERMRWFLSLSFDDVKSEIKRLQNIGF